MMSSQLLKTEDLLGSREIRFLDRKESNYPSLMRLCMDFDFCVLQLQRRTYSHLTNRYLSDNQAFVLVTGDYRMSEAETITPICDSMRKLEDYVTQNQIDILHSYLFGAVDDSIPTVG